MVVKWFDRSWVRILLRFVLKSGWTNVSLVLYFGLTFRSLFWALEWRFKHQEVLGSHFKTIDSISQLQSITISFAINSFDIPALRQIPRQSNTDTFISVCFSKCYTVTQNAVVTNDNLHKRDVQLSNIKWVSKKLLSAKQGIQVEWTNTAFEFFCW